MKIIFSTLLCCASLIACQQKPDGYVLNGNIAGPSDGAKVLLVNEQEYPMVIVDSTVIKNGKFQLKGKVDYPGRYRLIINKNNNEADMLASSFYLENSNITYSGHIDSLRTYYWSEDNSQKDPVIQGSASQDLYLKYEKETEKIHQEYRKLDNKYRDVYHLPALDGVFNTKEGCEIARQMEQVNKKANIAQWNFIEQNPGTIVGYDLASLFLEGMYVNLTIPQINQLTDIISKAWAAHPQKIEKFKAKAEKAKRMAIGAKYQDIELMNPEGKMVKLSEYVPEGKYVMLEFWASWCGPCRGEIPHLRHVYQNYKDKGFEIISISIDEKKEDWEKAMKEENMVWKQLCDPKGFEGPVAKTYNIAGVPTCIILDKQGHIFKTDMRGAALDAALEDLYN